MQMGRGLDQDSAVMEKVRERAEKRFEANQKKRRELENDLNRLKAELMLRAVEKLLEKGDSEELREIELTSMMQDIAEEIERLDSEPHSVSQEDFKDVLDNLEKQGILTAKSNSIILTSKGAQMLGRGFLTHVLLGLAKKKLGTHRVEDIGYGPWIASTFRQYEPGDPYERISIERSLIAALERRGGFRDMTSHDLRIHEPKHATEVYFGILVDQSASMRKRGKMEAAVETALALHELMRIEFPEDDLRILTFSEDVKQVEPWELPGVSVPQQFTDICKPLRIFRQKAMTEPGNKQVHLITDSAPNFLEGEFVGFRKAMEAVLDEVRSYRLNDIILNVIMLDDEPELKEMAKMIAQVNAGRVFYTDPAKLGEAVIEDYILLKKDVLSI